MKLIDISLSLNTETLTHPKEVPFQVEKQRDLEADGVATSKLTFATHFGTHVDAPAHFIKNGKGVDEVDLKSLIGPCQILKVTPENNLIMKSDLEGRVNSKRVLLKTNNSNLLKRPYTKDYTSLSLEAAEYLIGSGVVLVGTDYIAIEAAGSPGHPVHTKLLENEVVIVEGLDLANVENGNYEIIVLPLKLAGLDGSPARAVLVKK